MSATFIVTGSNREVGAIGIFESFEITVEAEDREQAADLTRYARYDAGFEHVHITEIVRVT